MKIHLHKFLQNWKSKSKSESKLPQIPDRLIKTSEKHLTKTFELLGQIIQKAKSLETIEKAKKKNKSIPKNTLPITSSKTKSEEKFNLPNPIPFKPSPLSLSPPDVTIRIPKEEALRGKAENKRRYHKDSRTQYVPPVEVKEPTYELTFFSGKYLNRLSKQKLLPGY